MTATRYLSGGIGVLIGVYGAWLLVSRQSVEQLVNVAVWLGAGVLLHDGVLAPAVVVVGWLVALRLPTTAARAAALVLLVLGPVTLVAVPVLFGQRADPSNSTLDSRDYALGLAAVAVVVLVGAIVFATWSSQRSTGTSDDADDTEHEPVELGGHGSGEGDDGADPGR